MLNRRKFTGLALATAAAGLFAAAGFSPAMAAKHMADEKVKCAGINECKGQGDCASAKNSCKGLAECKGLGWKEVTVKECDAKGGKILKS